jgi:transposase InsO family protein
LLQPIAPTLEIHTISIDFVIGLPESKGFNALLTITDKFSKAITLLPCRDSTTAQDAACLYFKHAYPTYGLPKKIISDRDPRFTSNFWQTLCGLLKIDLAMTTAYHPQADGQAEKTNQTVETALRCIIAGDEEKYHQWTDYLPILELELNSTASSSTGCTPNELRFSVPPRSIPDVLETTDSPNATAEELLQNLQHRRIEAKTAIAKAQRIQKKYFDQHRKRKDFKEGELAVLKFSRKSIGYKPPKDHSTKLAPLGTPVRIIKKLSPITYKIALPAGSRIHDVVSIAHLKKFGKDTGHLRPLPIRTEVDNDDDGESHDEWEVEAIHGHRTYKGKRQYLIKWRGYPDSESTWEPVDHLDNAQNALLKYIEANPEANPDYNPTKRQPTRPRRTSPRNTFFSPLDALYSTEASLQTEGM